MALFNPRPSKGYILILRDETATVMEFAHKKITNSHDCPTHRHVLKVVTLPDYPIQILLNPSTLNIKRITPPPLKLLDHYQYRHQLRRSQKNPALYTKMLPYMKEHKTIGMISCTKSAAFKTLSALPNPICGVSFFAVEALYLLKSQTTDWQKGWHILISRHGNDQIYQIAFYQGCLWFMRQTQQQDLASTITYIKRLASEDHNPITIHILADEFIQQILDEQTNLSDIVIQTIYNGHELQANAVYVEKLLQAPCPHLSLTIPELIPHRRWYYLPRLITLASYSLALIILGVSTWIMLENNTLKDPPQTVIPPSTKLTERSPLPLLKKIAQSLHNVHIDEFTWQNLSSSFILTLHINSQTSLTALTNDLQQQLPQVEIVLSDQPTTIIIKGTYDNQQPHL